MAVLPFTHRGSDPAVEALAEGMSEDVVTGLARFSYLQVISRSSTLKHAGEAVDVRAFGREVGARYVIEGSLRQAGSVLRIAVRLVDATTGAHLWAETYNRPFEADRIFELQDEVVPRIVSTVADMNGILPHTMSEALRSRDPRQLSPYEAVVRGLGYYERITVEEHAAVRDALERAVQEAPDNADAWALLAEAYAEEYKHGFNVRPDPLGRALEAARRAVAAAPSNHLAQHSLAQALFFRRELQAFRHAADRAVALNPMDGCTTAFLGILMAYAGDWDHGLALAERAMDLNPHYPGWYRLGSFFGAYRKKDYRAALDIALKVNMPSYYYTHAAIAAAYGQLGEREAAQGALRELLALKPDFAAVAREDYAKWFGPGELVEHILDGLRKAGLEIPSADGAMPPDRPTSAAGPRRGRSAASDRDSAVAIAVLPFSDMSPREGPGLPLRGDGRGDPERPRPRRGDPGRLTNLGLPRQPGGEGPRRDRQDALRRPRPRGKRPNGGEPPAGHRPAQRGDHGLPALVRALRPGAGGRLRRAGRDRRRRRRGREEPGSLRERGPSTPGPRPATSRPIGATCWASISGTPRRTTAGPLAPSRRPSASIRPTRRRGPGSRKASRSWRT